MESIIKESTNLHHEIDDCITKLLKARLDKDVNNENKAICSMESLIVNTMQHLSWMVEELKGNNCIKWKTGEPNKIGLYIVTLDDGIVTYDWWDFNPPYDITKMFTWVCHEGKIVAWCKLSDIKPYKEESK